MDSAHLIAMHAAEQNNARATRALLNPYHTWNIFVGVNIHDLTLRPAPGEPKTAISVSNGRADGGGVQFNCRLRQGLRRNKLLIDHPSAVFPRDVL